MDYSFTVRNARLTPPSPLGTPPPRLGITPKVHVEIATVALVLFYILQVGCRLQCCGSGSEGRLCCKPCLS